MMEQNIFDRELLLVGTEAMNDIAAKKIIIFGVGGVGSWCAESLVRSGVKYLTIVDSDVVCTTNVNRQLMATAKTIGRVKVEALQERLLEINPLAKIDAICEVYNEETAASFNLSSYDYIVDAIDSLKDKAHLILEACKTDATLFASMGAALKMDPAQIQVAEFWKVRGCPLAAALRRKFRHNKTFPAKKFKCVFSEELLSNMVVNSDASDDRQVRPNGTIAHVTAIFGFMLAGQIIQDIYQSRNSR